MKLDDPIGEQTNRCVRNLAANFESTVRLEYGHLGDSLHHRNEVLQRSTPCTRTIFSPAHSELRSGQVAFQGSAGQRRMYHVGVEGKQINASGNDCTLLSLQWNNRGSTNVDRDGLDNSDCDRSASSSERRRGKNGTLKTRTATNTAAPRRAPQNPRPLKSIY